VAASSATRKSDLPSVNIVTARPPRKAIPEYPFPSGRLQITSSPNSDSGKISISTEVPSRLVPRQRGQSAAKEDDTVETATSASRRTIGNR